MYNYLNTIETTLLPIEPIEWEQQHEWPYTEIGKRITTDHVLDVGSGCGLLGIFLVYYNYCKTVTLYEVEDSRLLYARALVDLLNLNDKVTIHDVMYTGNEQLTNTTISSTRFGSLIEFEKLIGNNKAITLRRTAEVEPLFTREGSKIWHGEIIQRLDGFELEVLTR
jgi:hypothetical protein